MENISYTYPRGTKPALRNISLEINEGDFIAVMGGNGAGKTTLCKLFNGVIPHSQGGRLEGRIWVDGVCTADTSVAALSSLVAVVPEESDANFFTATVRDEAAFGPENLCLEPDEINRRVTRALEAAGLSAYADSPPTALSGGQKQRLAIAAALAMSPRVLALDEPTSQLDPPGAADILAFIGEIRKRRGLTVIMATQNSEEAAEYADKICVLGEGSIAAFGPAREVFSNSRLLRDNRIRPPDVSALAALLAEKGEPLPFVPLGLDEAKTAVLEWYGVVRQPAGDEKQPGQQGSPMPKDSGGL